ncbi:MAG: hypothetical protein ACRC6T_11710 [Sarcina sp.]
MQELIETSNGSSNYVENMHPKDMQALFSLFNGRPEGKTKILTKAVKISRSDILELRESMKEKLEQYNVPAEIEAVSIRFEGNQFEDFSNWENFNQYKFDTSKVIESMILKWDFMIKFNQYLVPQRHTVIVRLASGLNPEQFLKMMITGTIEDIESIDKNFAPIMCSVSFVNHMISEEIVSLVENWGKGLEQAQTLDIKFKALKRYKHQISKTINIVTKAIGVITIAVFFNLFLKSFGIVNITGLTLKHMQQIVFATAIGYIVFTGMKMFANKISRECNESFSQYGEVFTFNLTKGDKIRQKEVDKQNEKQKNRVKKNLLLTLLINIICSLIATFLGNSIFNV